MQYLRLLPGAVKVNKGFTDSPSLRSCSISTFMSLYVIVIADFCKMETVLFNKHGS
jgi:hypothetical protein